jgi:hypothetical protein
MRPVRKPENLTTPRAVVMKYGNLNFLETSGPLQACNGTDFFNLWLFTNCLLFHQNISFNNVTYFVFI